MSEPILKVVLVAAIVTFLAAWVFAAAYTLALAAAGGVRWQPGQSPHIRRLQKRFLAAIAIALVSLLVAAPLLATGVS